MKVTTNAVVGLVLCSTAASAQQPAPTQMTAPPIAPPVYQQPPPPPPAPGPIYTTQQLPPADAAFPQGGDLGLSFAFPAGGGPTFGLAYFLSDESSLRMDFGLDINNGAGKDVVLGMSVGLGYRYRLTTVGSVAPFIQPAFFIAKPATGGDPGDDLAFGFSGGLGAEYFFNRHISAGAMTGLGLTIAGNGGDFDSVRLNTGTTAIFASLYW